jgi:hypothetical protein
MGGGCFVCVCVCVCRGRGVPEVQATPFCCARVAGAVSCPHAWLALWSQVCAAAPPSPGGPRPHLVGLLVQPPELHAYRPAVLAGARVAICLNVETQALAGRRRRRQEDLVDGRGDGRRRCRGGRRRCSGGEQRTGNAERPRQWALSNGKGSGGRLVMPAAKAAKMRPPARPALHHALAPLARARTWSAAGSASPARSIGKLSWTKLCDIASVRGAISSCAV